MTAFLVACGGGGGGDSGGGAATPGGTAAGGGSATIGANGGIDTTGGSTGTGSGASGTAGSGSGSSGAGSGSSGAGSGSSGSGAGSTGGGEGSSGSGGSGSSGGSGGSVVPASGTLQGSVPAATYPAGSAGANALALLNAARQGAGAGLVAQSAALDVAAGAHATYLNTNVGATGHLEEASKLNFYDTTPAARLTKAGFAAGFSSEEVGNGGTLLGADCVPRLLASVYHAVALLGPETHVGFGFGPNFATTPICVSVVATVASDPLGQVAPAGAFVTYPYDGQTRVVEEFGVDFESPALPAGLFANATAGTPIIVNVRNADYVNLLAAGTLDARLTRFELRDAGGNLVPAQLLAHPSLKALGVTSDPNLLAGAAVLVPLSPLVRGQPYTATFAATLQTGATPLQKTWRFTTNP